MTYIFEEFVLKEVEPMYNDHQIEDELRSCTDDYDGWHCTRLIGHKGLHEAMDMVGWICARWGIEN